MTNQEKLFYENSALKSELPFSPVLEKVGLVLKAEREKQGIELKTISQKLCIRESFLKALEDGEYDVFPALVYGAGFLRSYASFLGLDEKSIMVRFHAETENLTAEEPDIAPVVHKNVIPSKKLLLGLLVLVVALGIGYCLYNSKDAELPNVAHVEPIQEPVLEDVVVQPAPVSTDELVQTQETKPVDVKELTAELKSLIPQGENNLLEQMTGELFGHKGERGVLLLATDKVWVEIKKEDKVVFTRVMNKGDAYQVPVQADDMVLRSGNAGALSVYIGGKFKKVIGREGHVIKNVPLTLQAYEIE